MNFNLRPADRCAVLFFGIFAVAAAWITSQGPFVNEDFQKIQLNGNFLANGPILRKALEPEAGYEELYFRPVNNVILSALVQRWGTENAGPFRALTAFAFVLASASLYVLARLTGAAPAAAFWAALFLALHPFNAWFYFQGAWIGNVLTIPFMVLSWLAYRRTACASSTGASLLWAAVLFLTSLLAALCKDSGALIAFMLLTAAVFGRSGSAPRRAIAVFAAFAGTAVFLALRVYSLRDGPTVAPEYVLTALNHSGSVILQYLREFVTGNGRTYAKPLAYGLGWPLTLGFAALACAGLFVLRRRPMAAFLLSCMLIALSEVICAAILGFEMASPRMTLFSGLAALFAITVWKGFGPKSRKRAAAAAWGLLAFFAVRSASQVFQSLDAERFYAYHNRRPYSANMLFTEGLYAYGLKDWARSERIYEKSLQMSPRSFTLSNLAMAELKLGKEAEASGHLDASMSLSPEPATLNNMAAVLHSRGRNLEAVMYASKAIADVKEYFKTPWNLSSALAAYDEEREGLPYTDLIPLIPQDARLHQSLGLALLAAKKHERAALHFAEAVRLDSGFTAARMNLGISLAIIGRLEEAGRSFTDILLADPNNAGAHNNLGNVLMKLGRRGEAIEHFKEALRLEPGFAEARQNLTAANLALGTGTGSGQTP